MSERGSFVTEYIYCDKCFESLKKVLLARSKFLCSTTIPSWIDGEEELNIIAGKIGETYTGGELIYFSTEIIPEISKIICHPIRIAILPDNGEDRVFWILPNDPGDLFDQGTPIKEEIIHNRI